MDIQNQETFEFINVENFDLPLPKVRKDEKSAFYMVELALMLLQNLSIREILMVTLSSPI